MVLASQGVALTEEDLCDLLETGLSGTPVLSVLLLQRHIPGCHVTVASGSLSELRRSIAEGICPIVFVSTGPLSSSATQCLQALVVVAIEHQ
jgi:hypothetical protein